MYCQKCGEKIGDGAKFCNNCGHDLAGGFPEGTPANTSPDDKDDQMKVDHLYGTYRRPFWGSGKIAENIVSENRKKYGWGWNVFKIITAMFNPVLYLLGMKMGIYNFDLFIFIILCFVGLGIYLYIGSYQNG
jgi:hypothetical protein